MRTCSWWYSRKPSGTMVSTRLTAVPRASNWGLHTRAQRGVGFTAASRLRSIRPHRGCWCKARPTCCGWMNISLLYVLKLRSCMPKNQLYGSKRPSVMESVWSFPNLTKGNKNVPMAQMIWRRNVSMPHSHQVTPRYARQAKYQPCQATACHLLQATAYQPGDNESPPLGDNGLPPPGDNESPPLSDSQSPQPDCSESPLPSSSEAPLICDSASRPPCDNKSRPPRNSKTPIVSELPGGNQSPSPNSKDPRPSGGSIVRKTRQNKTKKSSYITACGKKTKQEKTVKLTKNRTNKRKMCCDEADSETILPSPHPLQKTGKGKSTKKRATQGDDKTLYCNENCTLKRKARSEMILCTLCMVWHHNCCVGEEPGYVGAWTCDTCWQVPTTLAVLQEQLIELTNWCRGMQTQDDEVKSEPNKLKSENNRLQCKLKHAESQNKDLCKLI